MTSDTYREIFPLSVREGGLNISCAEEQTHEVKKFRATIPRTRYNRDDKSEYTSRIWYSIALR